MAKENIANKIDLYEELEHCFIKKKSKQFPDINVGLKGVIGAAHRKGIAVLIFKNRKVALISDGDTSCYNAFLQAKTLKLGEKAAKRINESAGIDDKTITHYLRNILKTQNGKRKQTAT